MDERKTNLTEEELKLIEETERFMEEVNSDPDVANAPLPPQLRENIFNEIRAREAEKAKKIQATYSDEDIELIRLGREYKKRRKMRKYFVLVAALVLAMAFGVTSIGGPEKVFEKVSWFMGGREQVNVDSDDENIEVAVASDEEEAYEKIEDKFGFYPVKLDYLPQGIGFLEAKIGEEIQDVHMIYGTDQEAQISYHIRPNYRVSSWGKDIEDELLEEYEMQVDDTEIYLKKYRIEDDSERWLIGFEHNNVSYSLLIMNMDKVEVEKIVKNLIFF